MGSESLRRKEKTQRKGHEYKHEISMKIVMGNSKEMTSEH